MKKSDKYKEYCIHAKQSCLDSDDARHILRNRHQGGSLGKTIHRHHVETTFRLRLNQDLGATNLHLVEDLDAAQHEILRCSTFEAAAAPAPAMPPSPIRRPATASKMLEAPQRVFFFQMVRECAKNKNTLSGGTEKKHKEKTYIVIQTESQL